jgi:hypothetical protein
MIYSISKLAKAQSIDVGEAVVAPEVHDLIERADITNIVARQFETVRLHHRQSMLFENLHILGQLRGISV